MGGGDLDLAVAAVRRSAELNEAAPSFAASIGLASSADGGPSSSSHASTPPPPGISSRSQFGPEAAHGRHSRADTVALRPSLAESLSIAKSAGCVCVDHLADGTTRLWLQSPMRPPTPTCPPPSRTQLRRQQRHRKHCPQPHSQHVDASISATAAAADATACLAAASNRALPSPPLPSPPLAPSPTVDNSICPWVSGV